MYNNTRENSAEYIKFKNDVWRHSEGICACCLKKCERGVDHVHHLDGYNWAIDKRTDVSNGALLCCSCHERFHEKYGAGDNTKEQFWSWCRSERKRLSKQRVVNLNYSRPQRKKEKSKKNIDHIACCSACKNNVLKVCTWRQKTISEKELNGIMDCIGFRPRILK